jgi:two-component system response regulator FixJ
VDDKAVMRDAFFGTSEIRCVTFPTGREFLETYDDVGPACLLLDVRMPDIDGMDVQRLMKERGIRVPIIMVPGHADVLLAVEAMKAGAIEFIEKPFDWKQLRKMVCDQIEQGAVNRSAESQRSAIAALHDTLTPREREVAEQMVAGMPTKAIAIKLGTAFNTVNNQRKAILRKMQADSVVDLTRMLMTMNED